MLSLPNTKVSKPYLTQRDWNVPPQDAQQYITIMPKASANYHCNTAFADLRRQFSIAAAACEAADQQPDGDDLKYQGNQ